MAAADTLIVTTLRGIDRCCTVVNADTISWKNGQIKRGAVTTHVLNAKTVTTPLKKVKKRENSKNNWNSLFTSVHFTERCG